MFSSIFKQHKILRSIVISNFIYMMNNLLSLKITSQRFFHNQMASFNVSIRTTKWMVPFFDKDISLMFFNPSSRTRNHKFNDMFSRMFFPLVRKSYFYFSFLRLMKFFASNILAFFRAVFSFYSIRKYIKFFTTNLTDYFNHFYLQLKGLFSACLLRTVKSLRLLKAQVLDIKNPFLTSNMSITHKLIKGNLGIIGLLQFCRMTTP